MLPSGIIPLKAGPKLKLRCQNKRTAVILISIIITAAANGSVTLKKPTGITKYIGKVNDNAKKGKGALYAQLRFMLREVWLFPIIIP